MELDLLGTHADRAYPILASIVTPRPIAWVTTLNRDGSVNAAPFSFFNVFGANPPLVVFAPGDRSEGVPKDSALNCKRTGEFVVNMVGEEMGEAMVATAASLENGASETEQAGLQTLASTVVSTPRIAGVPAAMECKVHSIQEIGENRLIFGIVHRVHVADEFFDKEKLRVIGEKFHPLGRMASPNFYCRTGDLFEMERPD
ncbi:flavin reductase family protein [Luteolibacter sp. AS25]|uniref:flavin reductase family protein n=1 Tax=Luteolibacter sp. AS25 TaxID=3135776 RepID=UPI00398AB257